MHIIDQLTSDWNRSGIAEGSTVLLHSNISNALRRIKKAGFKPSIDIIFDSFLNAVGPDGTLVFPLFNFEFTQGATFNINETPSQMGSLTEYARNRSEAIRTEHPIYSFAAIGKHAGKFEGIRNFSGYGLDSPFGILHEMDATIAVLDLPEQNSMTFYHYVEECCEVSYRYHKKFTGIYVDANGEAKSETFGLFVRDVNAGIKTKVDPMGEILWEKGLYRGCRPKIDTGLRTINATTLFDETKKVLDSGNAKGVLYDVE